MHGSQGFSSLRSTLTLKAWPLLLLLLSCYPSKMDKGHTALMTFNGKVDPDGRRYPHLLKMYKYSHLTKKPVFACSAVAIGGPFLLTAAHCLIDDEDHRVEVKDLTLETVQGVTYKVERYLVDPYRFKEVDMHLELARGRDLGIMKADRDLEVPPATLIPVGTGLIDDLAKGTNVQIESTGFGYDSFGGRSGRLNYVAVPFNGGLSAGMELYLGNTQLSVCKGDSGGGSFLVGSPSQLIGIVSRDYNPWENTDACGGPTEGHVVTNIAHPDIRAYIEQALETLKDPVIPVEPGLPDALVRVYEKGQPSCVGVAKDEHTVLTAARCVFGKNLAELEVSLGAKLGNNRLRPTATTLPKEYAGTSVSLKRGFADLALLTFQDSLGTFKALPLLSDYPDQAKAKQALTENRLGLLLASQKPSRLWLYTSESLPDSLVAKPAYFRSFLPNEGHEFHAGDTDSFACKRDAGAPLLVELDGGFYLAGMMSRPYSSDQVGDDCEKVDGGIFTSLAGK